MEGFAIALGIPLGLLLYFISLKAEIRERNLKAKKELELNNQPLKSSPNDCICDWVNKSGSNEVRSGFCPVHKTTWL